MPVVAYLLAKRPLSTEIDTIKRHRHRHIKVTFDLESLVEAARADDDKEAKHCVVSEAPGRVEKLSEKGTYDAAKNCSYSSDQPCKCL